MKQKIKLTAGLKKLVVIPVAAVILISLFFLGSCSKGNQTGKMKNMQSQQVKVQTPEESIVREGVIDLNAIDKNKDGKVYQDQMHWNVISDSFAYCPICDMKLQEVTISEAKKNLINNGFKVK
jgi:hypothetical protein